MKTRNRIAAAAAVCMMAVSYTVPVYAETETEGALTKDETVYAMMNQDGSVRSVTVSEWLHSDEGLSAVHDISELSDIKNTKTDLQPVIDGNDLTWDTEEHDVYYTGTSDKTLPVELSIDYALDGVAMSAEEIAGKTGELSIHINVDNTTVSKENVDVEEKTTAVLMPYILMTVLSADSYTDVKAEDSISLNEGMNQIVAFVSVSGVSDVMDQLTSGELNSISNKIRDSFTVTMHVENAEVPSFMLISMDSDELSDTVSVDTGKLDEVQSGVSSMQSAVQEILDGTSQLKDANVQLDASMQEFQTQYTKFNDGISSADSGAADLTAGAEKLNDSLAELETALNTAMDSATEEQLAAMSKQLTEASAALSTAKTQIETLSTTVSALSSLPQSVSDGINGETSKTASSQAIANGTSAAVAQSINTQALAENYCTAYAGSYSSVNADATAHAELNGTYYKKNDDGTYTEVTAEEAATAVIDTQSTGSFDQSACTAATKAYLDSVVAGTQQASATGAQQASALVLDGIAQQEKEALQSQMSGLSTTLTEATATIDSMSAMIAGFQTLIVQEQSLISGISAMPAAVSSLHAGSTDLYNGAVSLESGLGTLKSSSSQISNAISQFKSATSTLASSTDTLNSGVQEFSDEGMDELSAQVDSAVGGINEVLDILDASGIKTKEYSNYAGAPEGAETSVKYILKTGAETVKTTAKEETAETTAAAEPAVTVSLWDKIRGLFD